MAKDEFYCFWDTITFYSDTENVNSRPSFALIACVTLDKSLNPTGTTFSF